MNESRWEKMQVWVILLLEPRAGRPQADFSYRFDPIIPVLFINSDEIARQLWPFYKIRQSK